ncbi:MAG: hypothetical protein CME10_09265 [Gemmatimonadetes bacterium]|nr:hypothetical protein [Gemmatimonadota bacterium]|tara:strand:- start:768 stop:1667 length:900 start_codon:yes stop_codon:yes gene_type:complete
MSDVMRGIFPVLQTPLKEDGELDEDSMKRQVDFCVEAGAHGLVFPVLGSEFQYLSEREREVMTSVVVEASDGRLPVVAGVAGPSKAIAVECTRGAIRAGADAVVALPPYLAVPNENEVRDYYMAIAEIARRPVFLQHTSGGLTTETMCEMFENIEHISYLKEEQMPSAHQITSVVERVGDGCLGVFGGGHGRWMISELRRGTTGFMPAVEGVDIHVQIWDAFEAGDESKARGLFNLLLPQINLILLLGHAVIKEILVRRGVFLTNKRRSPGSLDMDLEDLYELDQIMEQLKPHYRVNWN